MRSTHDHEDLVRYLLTDAIQGLHGHEETEVYCFIKLSGISFTKIDTFIILKNCLLLVKQLLFFFYCTPVR